MNLSIFWTMIIMHIVSALIAASLLTTLPSSARGLSAMYPLRRRWR